MRIKNLLVSGALAVMFILGSVFLWPKNKDLSNAMPVANQAANNINTKAGNMSTKVSDEPQIATPPQAFSSADIILMDANKTAAHRAWRRERGYYEDLNGNLQTSDYENYSDATLTELMEQNDIMAIQTLAARQREKEIDGKLDYIKTKALYYRAAVAGSTHALTELQSIDSQLHYIYLDSSPALAYQYSLNAQAWAQVRNMRGDTLSSAISDNMRPTEFSSAETHEIQAQAKEVYADLLSQRQARGLGDFDNTASEWQAAILAKMNLKKVAKP